ncbi:MAG: arginine--tRNA ligase [Candidatus Eisenbacteria bacterium]|uniref:Arginine--tRNA ligase n=1 Tax=Eiseniibacteriota bacterium TaxID=2212470 RepID=A0A948W6W3_UNCEI|nr:arginine--tRNA ligase [Candidatus Eisenbacteria bacterium]
MSKIQKLSEPRHPVERFYQAIIAALLAPLALPSGWLESLDPPLEPVTPPKPEMGDLALPCFPLAKSLKRAPAEIAATIAAAHPTGIPADRMASLMGRPSAPGLTGIAAAGPYVNFKLDTGGLVSWLLPMILEGEAPYGAPLPPTGRKIVLEYSGPNTNKPLHLGHVRNNVLGMSLSNILAATGENVVRVNIVNDRGIHICKSMISYRRWGKGLTPQDEKIKPDHFVGNLYVLFDQKLKGERAEWEKNHQSSASAADEAADEWRSDAEAAEDEFLAQSSLMHEARECLRAWEAEDPETRRLWKRMNDWVYEGFRETYKRMGCTFENWYRESETYKLGKEVVDKGLEQGVFYRKSDGSVWARLESEGLDDKLLLRSDGTSIYITQDLGTAVKRYEDEQMDRSLYVVGSEQVHHFKTLFAILKILGYPWAGGCHHVRYGLINLPRGMGKLKSREGRRVDADTLLDQLRDMAVEKIESAIEEGKMDRSEVGDLLEAAERVGQAALKLYLLQVSADKNIVYDPDATLQFAGDTGPAIQYSHARIHGILRKGIAQGLVSEEDLDRESTNGFASIRVRGDAVNPALLTDPHERALLMQLMAYPAAIDLAARTLSPSPVANYLLELTKMFARFYHNCPVLKADTKELVLTRLQLCLATAGLLRRGLALLTVEAPERM